MKLKKLITGVLTATMVISSTVIAFGAELSAGENAILDKLQASNVPSNYITQARNYFLQDEVTISEDDADLINDQIDAAKEIAGSVTELKNLSAAQKADIADAISEAAEVIDLVAAFDANKNTITVKDSTGATVFVAEGEVIKQTGVSMNTTILVICVLALALASCGVVVFKKKSVNA